MKHLKLHSALLVGEVEDKEYFQNFFKEIYLVRNNREALRVYNNKKSSIIFLCCDKKTLDLLETIKKIRKYDRETILIVIVKTKSPLELLDALSLHLSGYIEKPFEPNKVQELLENITHDLHYFHKNILTLKDNHTYNRQEQALYNEEKEEIKLTKNELIFLELVSTQRNHYFSSEFIEQSIWEEVSCSEDCNKRLKYLIYGLRKKLPSDSILNTYKLGYKLVSVV